MLFYWMVSIAMFSFPDLVFQVIFLIKYFEWKLCSYCLESEPEKKRDLSWKSSLSSAEHYGRTKNWSSRQTLLLFLSQWHKYSLAEIWISLKSVYPLPEVFRFSYKLSSASLQLRNKTWGWLCSPVSWWTGWPVIKYTSATSFLILLYLLSLKRVHTKLSMDSSIPQFTIEGIWVHFFTAAAGKKKGKGREGEGEVGPSIVTTSLTTKHEGKYHHRSSFLGLIKPPLKHSRTRGREGEGVRTNKTARFFFFQWNNSGY